MCEFSPLGLGLLACAVGAITPTLAGCGEEPVRGAESPGPREGRDGVAVTARARSVPSRLPQLRTSEQASRLSCAASRSFLRFYVRSPSSWVLIPRGQGPQGTQKCWRGAGELSFLGDTHTDTLSVWSLRSCPPTLASKARGVSRVPGWASYSVTFTWSRSPSRG